MNTVIPHTHESVMAALQRPRDPEHNTPLPDKLFHFGGGVVVTEWRIPAGAVVRQHVHTYDHISVLVSGHVTVHTDQGPRVHYGHSVLVMPAGVEHAVQAHTDSVWLCIHAENSPEPT